MRYLTLLLGLGLGACSAEAHPEQDRPAQASAEHAHGAGRTQAMIPLMQGLERQMAAAAVGLWRDDFAAIARAGEGIADHPGIEDAELQRLRTALGDRFGEFERADVAVHEAGLALREAGIARDVAAATRAFTRASEGCVGCHTAVRAQVRAGAPR